MVLFPCPTAELPVNQPGPGSINMKSFITSIKTLWILFALSLALAAGFVIWIPSVGGVALDSVASVADAQSLLASMTAIQRNSHFWMTSLLDMLFPLAYGGLFCGLALKYAGRYGPVLALPALIVIPVDILENIIQLISLRGQTSLLDLKALLTPIKFSLFYAALLIAVASLIFNLVSRLRNKAS